jgi:Coenzyme A transferase
MARANSSTRIDDRRAVLHAGARLRAGADGLIKRDSKDMIDKTCRSLDAALQGVPDGANVMIVGFGGAGQPNELVDALIAQGEVVPVRASSMSWLATNAASAFLADGARQGSCRLSYAAICRIC